MVADSDDLILLPSTGGELQSQLEIGRRGLKSGALEAWERLLLPENPSWTSAEHSPRA